MFKRRFEDPTLQQAIEKEVSKYKPQIEEYEKILEELKKVEGIKLDSVSRGGSLAYLVENFKRKNPENWQDKLANFRDKIKDINSKEGKVGIDWFLEKTISTAYIEELRKKREAAKNESIKESLGLFIQIQQNSLEFGEKYYKQGEATGFGGVSKDSIPEWYWIIAK